MPRTLAATLALCAFLAAPQAMAADASESGLLDTHWKLVSIRGMPAEPGRRDSFLLFRPDGGLSGSTGCNNLGAVYTLDGDQIAFSPIMTTRMYCQEVARTERELLRNLPAVARFVVDGNRLELLSDIGVTLAVFEAASA